MSQSTTPPLDPVLLPGSESPKRKLAAVAVIKKASNRHGKSKRRNSAKLTIENAFNFFYTPYDSDHGESEFQTERAVRSVAYLLHYLSQYGNTDANGAAADGLAHTLEKCAAGIALGRERQDFLREHGGKS